MAKLIEIEGAGGGGGKSGGSSSGPIEAPNTLQSFAKAKFVDLLLEGVIEGWADADPAKCIILNKVAVKNPDGSTNYKGLAHVFLPGTSDQPAMPGFENITTERDVGRRVRNDTPVIYPTVGDSLTAIIPTVLIPALTRTDKKNGNVNGGSVSIAIDIRSQSNNVNQWIENVVVDTINGKNTSSYERSYFISLDGKGPWLVRMRRTSPDTNDVTIQDQTMFSHITEVVEHRISYSDSAVVGIEIDAEQFGTSIAERSYDLLLQHIEYPSNYDPKTRVYSGFWDGTFKTGWCDNPAWVFRTIGTHERFGADVDPRYMDKWGLYQLAKFNDELVPDGRGGMEPRFVFNGLLKSQQDAYKVLQQIASMMRSIVFYGAGSVIVRQDRPMQAERNLYTPANVLTEFNYGSTALRVRHNSAVVQWINPDLGYDTDYTMYDEGSHIIQFGRKQLSLQAIGTTSEGQAYRQGKWAVLTELYQTDTVTFTAGKDSADALPGDVIEIADPHWATADFGGRVVPLGDNVIPYTSAKISQWQRTNVAASAATMKPGIRGATQLTGFTNTDAAQGGSLGSGSVTHTPGVYTASVYVDRSSWPYVVFGINGLGLASFNVKKNEVRAKTPGVIAAWTENEGLDLIRLCITYRVTDTTPRSFYVGFEGPNLGISGSSNTVLSSRPVPVTSSLFVGSPQVEAGEVATRYCPPLADRNSQLVLDRDIDFTGTGPQLHITMLDGNYDDVDGLDNTDRPARRKVNVRSFNVIGWDPELGVISLATSVPAGGNDFQTPFMWIFSKDQLKPRKWKIVSIEESDDREYNIVAINYAPEKFIRMDENYILHEQDEGPFTNLPNTSFCYPPKNVHATYQTRLKNGIITASINVSWEASPDKFLNGYILAYRRDSDNWVTMPLTTEVSVDFTDMPIGTYTFALRAVNKFGVASAEISSVIDISELTVEGKTLVYGIVTDRGDTMFTDRDIKIFWQSNALSADPSLASVTATVYSDNNPGFLLEDGGYMVQEDLQNPFGLEVSDDNVITVEDADGATPRLTVKGATWDDEQITVRIGLSAFYVAASNKDTSATIAKKIADVIDPDPRFAAVVVGETVTISYSIGGTNASEMEAVNDPLFKAYVVSVIDPSTNRVMQTDYVKTPEYRYSYSVNVKNSGVPLRSVRFSITVQDVNDKVSMPTIATISNPAPVFTTAEIIPTFGEVKLRFTAPIDPDFAGIIVWMGLASGFIPSEQNKYWQDRGQPAIAAPPGTTVYLRYAYYDLFGTTGITLSPEVTVKIPDISLNDIDTTPPAIPTLPTNPLTYTVGLDAGKNPVITQTFTWNKVSDEDVAGYDIQYRENNGPWIGGNSVAKEYNSHALPVKANTQYSAQVRAYDRVGNTSQWSAIATALSAKDTTPPGLPTNIALNTSLGMVRLTWTNDAALDLTNVEVWESATPSLANAKRAIVLTAAPSKEGGYLRSLLSGETVYFWLKSFDSSGNGSAFTAMIGPAKSELIRYEDFTPNVRPIGNLVGLPDPNGYVGPALVFNTTDGKLYAYSPGPPPSWKSATGVEPGTIDTTQLVNGSVTAEKLRVAFAGGNRALNADFSRTYATSQGTAPAGYQLYDNSNGSEVTATIVPTPNNSRNGNRFFAVQFNQNTNQKGVLLNNVGGGVNNASRLLPNTTYVISWWGRGSDGATGAGMGLFWNVGPTSVVALENPTLANGAGWMRFAYRVVTGAAVDPNVFISILRTGGGPGIIDIADIQIEEGELPTPFKLAFADGEVTTGKLSALAVTADKIAANAVVADKIAANSIATNKLTVASRPLSTTGINLRVNALGECVWDDGYVNIVSDTGSSASYFVSAGRLYGKYLMYAPGRPSFDQTNDDNVITDPNYKMIAKWQVGTANLVVYAGVASLFNGDQIVTGTMNANKIIAGTITAQQIQAGTIGAAQIAAGAISTDKLLVMQQGSALNRDPNFSDRSAWAGLTTGADIGTISDGPAGNKSLVISNQNATVVGAAPVAVDVTKTYRVRFWSRSRANGGGVIYGGFELRDANNQNIPSGGGTFWYPAASSQNPGFGWQLFEAQFGAGTATPLPASARTMSPLVIGNYWPAGQPTTSVHEFQDLRIEEVLGATSIKDGVITTQKLAAYAVTAINIAAGVITGDKISTTTSLPGTITVGNTGVTIETVRSTAQTALDKANGNGTITDSLIQAITSDDKLSYGEKSELIARFEQTERDYLGAYNQSADMIPTWGDVTYDQRVNLVNSWNNLNYFLANLISPAWNDITTISDVNGVQLRARFADMYANINATLSTVAKFNSTVTANPAKRINEFTTLIEPGRISVTGSYTFDNWKNGPNSTDIRGSAIGANTISGNKLMIGNRGVTVQDFNFQCDPGSNTVTWGGGAIGYVDDAGNGTYTAVQGGSAAFQGSYVYLSWIKGSNTLLVTNSLTTAIGDDRISLAIYQGGSFLIVNYGGTIIDGDRITTGSINADRIRAGTVISNLVQVQGTYGAGFDLGATVVSAYNPAQRVNQMPTTIDGGKITAYSVTAIQIAASTITADRMNVGSLSAITANLGTVTAGVVQSADGRVRFDLNAGTFAMTSASSGQRFYLDTNGIRIYDGNNTLRIRIGL